MKRVTILNVPFDAVTLQDALEMVLERLKKVERRPFFIATPNPEMLLEARKSLFFRQILQHTDLNIPDGFGIILASKFLRNALPKRVTGTDLMQKICESATSSTKIFLLGAGEGVAENAKLELEKAYPQVKIVGTYSGSPDAEEEKRIQKMITLSEADMLFVAFGAPKQELWLARNLPHLPTVKVAMGVGGAFDFIAGIRKRAPMWMQKIGLEWLYRLIKQPSRIRRIYNATVVFPWIFLKSLLNKKF